MNTNQKIELISQVGEEIITTDELRQLLETVKKPICYDGFETSGKIHIAQGLLRALNVNKMTRAGCKFKLLVADWHAWANNKLDGTLETNQLAGHYMIEVWKATKMDFENVEFVWANDLIGNADYWKKVMQIARNSTVKRIIRCSQIMGRSESDALNTSQIIYPCMQAADIFHLDVNIAQLGMDQRKVNVLARELADKLGYKKPVAVHHHMLLGLQKPTSNSTDTLERAIALKMSKSNPDSAIFMTDSSTEVERKISKAYCPEKIAAENPILEYARYIVFETAKTVTVERPAKFGGDKTYLTYAELEADFVSGQLHPMDLKQTVARALNAQLEPVRKHFEKNARARDIQTRLEAIEQKQQTKSKA